jgi:hypothetical protein
VPVGTPNPNLPAHPLFSYENAENDIFQLLLGPFEPSTRVAITSFTFDGGGSSEFGTQVRLHITDCNEPSPATLDIVTSFQVRNFANRTGPQHYAYPVPVVLPLEDPGTTWCLHALPTDFAQTLITTVCYVISPQASTQ